MKTFNVTLPCGKVKRFASRKAAKFYFRDEERRAEREKLSDKIVVIEPREVLEAKRLWGEMRAVGSGKVKPRHIPMANRRWSK